MNTPILFQRKRLKAILCNAIRQIIIFIFFSLNIWAQKNSPAYIRHLTTEDGLRQSSIMSLYQDSQGFIWIGTEDGLHKYDGYTFKVYSHQIGDENSLIFNSVNTIEQDSFGHLWLGTDFGLSLLDLETDSIRTIPLTDNRYSRDQFPRIRHLLFSSTDSVLWIASDRGLDTLKVAGKNSDFSSVKQLPLNKNCPVGIVWRLLLDSNGDLWFGTNYGIGKWINKADTIKYSCSNRWKVAFDIKEDAKNYIWVSSDKHIEFFHRDSFGFSANKKISIDSIRYDEDSTIHDYNIPLCRDRAGNIWAATVHGLVQFSPGSEKDFRILSEYDDQAEPVRHHYTTMIQDKSNMFWIGSFGGINKLKLNEQRFEHYKVLLGDNPGVNSGFIRSIHIDDKETIWFGTQGAGLFSLKNGEVKPKFFPLGSKLKKPGGYYDDIIVITEDLNNNIWLGTRDSGLFILNKNTEKVDPISLPDSLNHAINTLLVDHKGHLWIGMHNHLIHLRNNANKPDLFVVKNTNISIRTIAQDTEGTLWIGTMSSGLFKFYPNSIFSNHPKLIPIDSSNSKMQHGQYKRINKILPDPDQPNILWVCTYGGGLVRLNTNNNTPQFFDTETTDLQNNIIYGVLKDKKNRLWLSSNNGISRLDLENNKVIVFDYRDGLQSNEFNSGVCFQKNGKMYFGGSNGFNSFYPDSIRADSFKPPIAFTDFYINNEKISAGKHPALQKHINYTKEIVLTYNQRNISFDIAALDFYIPEKNQFAYLLEGYSEKWDTMENRRFINFTNLNAGNYTLKVIGANHDGVWIDEKDAVSIDITIKPPWYKTNIAYFIYFLLLCLAMWFLWKFQMNKIRAKQAELKAEQAEMERDREHLNAEQAEAKRVIERQREKDKLQYEREMRRIEREEAQRLLELEEEKRRREQEEALRLKELNEERTAFYTNITHDFRTPLTNIMGTAENLKPLTKDTLKIDIQNRLDRIIYNSGELLNMVDQMMTKAALDRGEIAINWLYGDIVPRLKYYVESFESLAKEKNIRLSVDWESKKVFMDFDENKLFRLVTNILKNAFDHTKEGGKITFHLRKVIENDQPFLLMRFEDNGEGILEEDLPYIFEDSYRGKSSVDTKRGFGLGLAVTKKFVELLDGTITVASKFKIGTEFRVLLPIKHQFVNVEPSKSNPLVEKNPPSYSRKIEKVKDSISDDEDARRILIIEDNEDLALLLAEGLSESFEIAIARDGEEGIEKATNLIPDIIISDVMMPKKNGFEVVRSLKEELSTNHIPIIFLTARNMERDRLEGLGIGAIDYLTKPYKLEELKLKLQNIAFLIKNRQQVNLNKSKGISDPNDELLKKINSLISEDPKMDVNMLSYALNIHRTTLYRKIRALTGQKPLEYINSIRSNSK